MHPNALLELNADLLRAVLRLDSPADGVVSAFFRQHRALGPRERHSLAETTYEVLRQRLALQHLAQSGSGALERRLAVLGWQGSPTGPACPTSCATTCLTGWPGPCANNSATPTSGCWSARWPRRHRWTCGSTF
jgi:hypothetical protein